MQSDAIRVPADEGGRPRTSEAIKLMRVAIRGHQRQSGAIRGGRSSVPVITNVRPARHRGAAMGTRLFPLLGGAMSFLPGYHLLGGGGAKSALNGAIGLLPSPAGLLPSPAGLDDASRAARAGGGVGRLSDGPFCLLVPAVCSGRLAAAAPSAWPAFSSSSRCRFTRSGSLGATFGSATGALGGGAADCSDLAEGEVIGLPALLPMAKKDAGSTFWRTGGTGVCPFALGSAFFLTSAASAAAAAPPALALATSSSALRLALADAPAPGSTASAAGFAAAATGFFEKNFVMSIRAQDRRRARPIFAKTHPKQESVPECPRILNIFMQRDTCMKFFHRCWFSEK